MRGEVEEGSERESDPGGKLITEHAMQFSGSVPPLHHTPPFFAFSPPSPSLPPPLVSGALFTILLTYSLSCSSICQAVPFQHPLSLSAAQ